MDKSLGELIDGLSVVNIKIFVLVDKIQQDKHTREDASKLQKLNLQRNQFINALNVAFNEKGEIIKI